MMAAHVRPMGVCSSYFMSRYALSATDMMTFAPFATASAGLVFGRQCWTIEVGSSFVGAISSQPIICLPCDCTMSCTRSTNASAARTR
jgi:hypothetical protein